MSPQISLWGGGGRKSTTRRGQWPPRLREQVTVLSQLEERPGGQGGATAAVLARATMSNGSSKERKIVSAWVSTVNC